MGLNLSTKRSIVEWMISDGNFRPPPHHHQGAPPWKLCRCKSPQSWKWGRSKRGWRPSLVWSCPDRTPLVLKTPDLKFKIFVKVVLFSWGNILVHRWISNTCSYTRKRTHIDLQSLSNPLCKRKRSYKRLIRSKMCGNLHFKCSCSLPVISSTHSYKLL